MTIGFDPPLNILPFDQRESFQTKMFGWEGTLSLVQTAETAIAGGAPKELAANLVDEQWPKSKRPNARTN